MYVSLTYPFKIVQHTLLHIVEHRKSDSLATPDNIVRSTVTSCWTNNVLQFDPSLSMAFSVEVGTQLYVSKGTQRSSSNSKKLLRMTYYSQNLDLKNVTVKKFGQFLKSLTMKLSIFKNKRTSHSEILIKLFRS